MIVVLAILALVAGLVVARGPQRSAALEMHHAAETIASTLRVARTQAIAKNRPVPVTIDVRTATIRIADQPAQTLPPGMTIGFTVADGQGTPETSPDRGSITFLPDGSATGGQIRLAANGRAEQIGVDWLTGRISTGRIKTGQAHAN